MQKLFNTITFSKSIRKNIAALDALLDVANNFAQICEVNRTIREYQRLISVRMKAKPSFICRLELRELRRQIRTLRGRIVQKTVLILNNSAVKAA